MTIKAAFLDYSETMVTSAGVVVPGISTLVDSLQKKGIVVATGTNNRKISVDQISQTLATAGVVPDLLLSTPICGAGKGTGQWVEHIRKSTNVSPNEIVMLGDDQYDLAEALHSGTALFDAQWGKGIGYGIPLSRPESLNRYLDVFFSKDDPWYWRLTSNDAHGRPVEAYAVTDQNIAGIPGLPYNARGWFKSWSHKREIGNGHLTVRHFIMMHVLSSIYLSGIHRSVDVWTTCPGSRGSQNSVMQNDLTLMAKMFLDKYVEVFDRHTASLDSGAMRSKGKHHLINFDNQVTTLLLKVDPKTVRGKRVLVVDDMLTDGFTLDACRNLLLQAGASAVVSVAFEKYHDDVYYSYAPQAAWDSQGPCPWAATDFDELVLHGSLSSHALDEMRRSYAAALV